ncbi:MAG TPA: DUF4407 domain-containing protein, partial [Segeticoccus sp.]|uniref:DUF4407 domain-containing protein n=1 Tax=Segeticoccus sp. TaxID=2706531 RepID=UPI002D7EE4E2
ALANFDRWLIAATTRQRTIWGNIQLAIPRFLLALVIGAVLSTPLTLQVFGGEINNELKVMQAEQQAAFTQQLASDPRFRGLPQQRAELNRLQHELTTPVAEDAVYGNPEVADLRTRLADLDGQLSVAEQAVVCEKEGTCGSGVVGAGPAFHEKVDLRDRLRRQRQQTQAALTAKTAQVRRELGTQQAEQHRATRQQVASLRAQVITAQAERDRELAAQATAVRNGDGLLARLEALERISSGDRVMLAAHLALFLFLTSIECLPVLFKLMLNLAKPTLYELLGTLEDEASYDAAVSAFRATRERQQIDVQAALDTQRRVAAGQMSVEVSAHQQAFDAQQELAEEAIAVWQLRQRQRLQEDPDAFVVDAPPTSAARRPSHPSHPSHPVPAR